MTALHVTGLTKSFGSTHVLGGVDLTCTSGVTAVLGASGCGKTTLLRLVAGFLQPDAGRIALGDRVVAEPGKCLPARQRRVGYVPQEGALFPHLDAAGNIGFGLPRRERSGRVEQMLELVELTPEQGRRYPHELSGGQQQRVALARALAPAPAVVLLDEPFSSLDASLREETGRTVVRALRAAETTAVLVTHDQGEALSLADQVAVMSAGRFLQVAPPDVVYSSPASTAVATFVGHAALVPARAAGGTAHGPFGTVPVRGARDGDVVLAVRPEQVVVLLDDHHPKAPGFKAEVLEVSYFGHDATLRARMADAHDVVVMARVPASGVPVAGASIRLAFDGEVVSFAREDG